MIPNILHFIFGLSENFGGKPFSFSHYMAIRSAIIVNKPDDVIFHYQYEPSGEYWDLIKGQITLKKTEAPEEIHGNKLFHVAHKADIIRLQALYETGGVYLDIDTISIKPLDVFRKYSFAIGQELEQPVEYTLKEKLKKMIRHTTLRPFKVNIAGLCNAVMLAERGAIFIEHWLESYKTFRSNGNDQFWGEHSVLVPYQLSKTYPKLVQKINPYAFHYPLYNQRGLELLFEKSANFPKAYIHHLWESASWDKYLKHLNADNVRSENTTYNLIARKYL
jgi:hypothetical protein